MIPSTWKRQNNFITRWRIIFLALLFVLLSGYPIPLPGLESEQYQALSAVLLGLLATVLVMYFNRRYADSLLRVLRSDFDDTEFALRKVLKEKHIRFQRRTEEDATQFEFTGYDVSLRVEPYTMHVLEFSTEKNPKPATSIFIHGLNEKDDAFTDKLVEAIDKIAT